MASEQLKYKTLYQAENIEIRHYDPALFATVSSPGGLFDNRNSNFSKLAGYIFGGNEDSQKISMTSPVTMKEKNDSAVMSFMIPSKWEKKELPDPNSEEINFEQQDGFYAITITFGGYSNQEKYEKYKKQLVAFARQNNLKRTNEIYLLGYDPPFKVINRKNEILIKLKSKPSHLPE